MTHRISRHLPWMTLAFSVFSSSAFAAPPVAVDDLRVISVGGSITLNVMANDYDPDGDTLIVIDLVAPEFGSATLNNDGSIFYQAPADFSGDVTFHYTLGDDTEEVASAPGNITIRVQNNPYQPYATNENDRGLADVIAAVCAELQSQSDAELSIAERQLLRQCEVLGELALRNPDQLGEALNQIAPEEILAQMRVASASNEQQTRVIVNRVQQQKIARRANQQVHSLAINGRQMQSGLRGAGASADEPEIWSKLGIFANVVLEESEREQTGLENGYESSANGFTVGADYFLNQSWLIGSSFGLSDSTLDYLGSDGELETSTSSVNAFAAFFHNSLSLYAQVGQSWLEFDSVRRVQFGVDDFTITRRLISRTEGEQNSLNTRIEWDWQKNALRLTPFARVDYLQSNIEGFGEQGDGGYAMSMSEQKSSQTTLSAGLLATYVLTPGWGVLQPTLGLTYLSENQVDRDPVSVQFAADPDDSRRFVLLNDGGDSGFYQVAVGASAVFKHGLSGFVDYTKTLSYDYLNLYQVQLGVRYEL